MPGTNRIYPQVLVMPVSLKRNSQFQRFAIIEELSLLNLSTWYNWICGLGKVTKMTTQSLLNSAGLFLSTLFCSFQLILSSADWLLRDPRQAISLLRASVSSFGKQSVGLKISSSFKSCDLWVFDVDNCLISANWWHFLQYCRIVCLFL